MSDGNGTLPTRWAGPCRALEVPSPRLPPLSATLPRVPNDRGPAALPAISLFILLAVLQLTAGSFAQYASVPLGLLFTELLLFGAPALLVLYGSNLRLAFLQLRPPDLKVLGLAALLGVANFPLAGGIASVCRELAERAQALLDPQSAWWSFLRWSLELSEIGERVLGMQHGIWRVLVVVAACVAAPLCEELAFRGVIQPALSARWGAVKGLVLAAALFSLMHVNPILAPALFELGLVFGLVVIRTGSLLPAILMHAVHNSLTAAILYSGAEESLDPADLQSSLVMTGVGLALCAPLLWTVWGLTESTARPVPAPEKLDPEAPVRFRPGRVWVGTLAWLATMAAALAALNATSPNRLLSAPPEPPPSALPPAP